MLSFFFIPAVIGLLFVGQKPFVVPQSASLTFDSNTRALFVTAHPDDECLFFGPTITYLKDQGSNVHALILSNGNAEGLGQTREEELVRSYETMGVERQNVAIVDHPELQDSMTALWSIDLLANLTAAHTRSLQYDYIFTFDKYGVSDHPNHIAVGEGVAEYLRRERANAVGVSSRLPRVFRLETGSVLRKYTGVLGLLAARVVVTVQYLILCLLETIGLDSMTTSKSLANVSFIATPHQYVIAFRAMRKHETQLVWFRWLYLAFSRYMWVNDFNEV